MRGARPNPAVFTQIRHLAREAIAKAPELGPQAMSRTLKLGMGRRSVKKRGSIIEHRSQRSSQRSTLREGTARSEEYAANHVVPEMTEGLGAGVWLDFMGVRKWVANKEEQDNVNRMANGKKPKIKKTKEERARIHKEREERRANRFTPVGGGVSLEDRIWPGVPVNGVRQHSIYLRGGNQKPPPYQNPLDNNTPQDISPHRFMPS